MLFNRVAVDINIIHVSNIYNVKKTVQRLINIDLESSRYISQSKRYYHVFPKSISRAKRRLLFISLLNTDPVICVPKIELYIDPYA